MDQVTLVWNTGSWGILTPKRKYKTFNLEQRPVATVDVSLHFQASSPLPRSKMIVLSTVSLTTPTVMEVSNQYNNQTQQFKPPFTTDEITGPTYLPQTPAQRQTDKHSSQRRYAKEYPDMDRQQAINAFFRIYRKYPDICNTFTIEPNTLEQISRDFIKYGHPTGLDVALHDNNTHMLILIWDKEKKFHYKLVSNKRLPARF
ncbi:MAG: hypothetical protein V4544_05460 [Pseudomonadota bacterium]